MTPTLLKQGTERNTGKEAQQSNFTAAKEIAGLVATTLGPRGLDKLIVDPVGNIIVTNDGVTILNEMQIDHPAARMIVEVAKTQEEEVGDGTTTAVILAGEMIKKAEELMGKGIHPSVIVQGYRKAEEKAQHLLREIALPITIADKKLMTDICSTAMVGKGAEGNRDFLSSLVVQAIESNYNNGTTNRNDIKVSGIEGSKISKSELVNGVVLEKEKMHPNMPSEIKSAKVCLLSSPLRTKTQDATGEEQVSHQIQRLTELGITTVFCERDIDDYFLSGLIENEIMAVKFVPRNDMELLTKVTGAKIYNSILNIKDIGEAEITEKEVGKKRFIFVRNKGKVNTIFVRGATEHIVDEIQRSITDAIGDIYAALNDGKIVGGAGAGEIMLARLLRGYANSLQGKEQIIIQAYAEAIESIPIILAENSGLDAIEIITTLRASEEWKGIDVFSGKICNVFEKGIVEPLRIKTQALSSATEVAEMILRIDDVVLGKSQKLNNMEG